MSQMLLGRDNQATGHAIQAMDDTGPKKSSEGSLPIQMTLEDIGKSPVLKISDGMCDKAGGFIDNDQPWIFVDNRDKDRFRIQQLVRRLNQPKGNTLASKDTVFRGGWLIIDLRQTGRHHSINAPRRVVAEMLRKERVDPNP
jgi:hypothetical protein